MKLVSNEIVKDIHEILSSDKYTDEENERFLLFLSLLGEYFCET